MKKRGLIYLFFGLLSLAGILFWQYELNKAIDAKSRLLASAQAVTLPVRVEKKIEVAVAGGDVFETVGTRIGLDQKTCYQIYDQTKDVYDLAKLKAGNKFIFYYGLDNRMKKIVYGVDADRELTIDYDTASSTWCANLAEIVYEIKEKTVNGALDASSSSLYLSALVAGADEGAVLEFASSLEWNIDFALDPRIGDKYKFVYEARYRNGQYVMPGRVLAGAYLNDGQLYETFYFEESTDNAGYFDAKGNSVQKMFLKAPLAFKYISSPFTTGLRYLELFNISTGHRAVDYAAAYGTPIRAVGDGTVTFAGWSSAGYGYLTTVRHNATYSTNYGHQSKIIVKRGQRVKQGQVIGYVGSTGLSTGSHLHFEMVKNGVKINPSKEILPPGKPIGAAKKSEFEKIVTEMKDKIKID